MHAALVFEPRIGALAVDIDNGFLHAAKLGFVEVDDLPRKTMLFAIALIHAVEIVGKERRFLSPRACADLERTAALVVLVLGKKQDFKRLLHLGKRAFAGERLVKEQFAHLARLLFRLGKRFVALGFLLFVGTVCFGNGFQLRPLPRERAPVLHVGERLGTGQKLAELLIACRNGV